VPWYLLEFEIAGGRWIDTAISYVSVRRYPCVRTPQYMKNLAILVLFIDADILCLGKISQYMKHTSYEDVHIVRTRF